MCLWPNRFYWISSCLNIDFCSDLSSLCIRCLFLSGFQQLAVCLLVCLPSQIQCPMVPLTPNAHCCHCNGTDAQCCHWQPATKDKCWKDDIYWSTSKSGCTSPLLLYFSNMVKWISPKIPKQFCSLIGQIRQIHFAILTNTFYNFDK